MPRTLPAHVLSSVQAVVDSQGGLITRSQLVQLGLPHHAISSLTRSGGRWQRLLPATYFTLRKEPSAADRERAAMLYAGRDAVLSGQAALRHYGMRYAVAEADDPTLHVLIPYDRSVVSRGFVRIERTKRLPTPVPLHGLPVAPMVRALFDAVRHSTDRRGVRAVLLEALQNDRVLVGQLEAEFDAGQRRWTALARDVVREYRAGSASAPEAELRVLWEGRSLPPLAWNAGLWTPEGEFVGQVDGYDVEAGMAIEMQSREFHSGRKWDEGLARLRRLAARGVVVVSVTPKQLRQDPDGVLSDLVAARQPLLGRPLPRLVVHHFAPHE